jgi:hypothetical protein
MTALMEKVVEIASEIPWARTPETILKDGN